MSAPRRSILSQILSGLTYVAIGAIVLDLFLVARRSPLATSENSMRL